MKTKTETVAQEALRLLSPVPNKEWVTCRFTNGEDKACFLGQYYRFKNNNGEFPKEAEYGDPTVSLLRQRTKSFIEEKYKINADGVDVNDSTSVNNYRQEKPKARVSPY